MTTKLSPLEKNGIRIRIISFSQRSNFIENGATLDTVKQVQGMPLHSITTDILLDMFLQLHQVLLSKSEVILSLMGQKSAISHDKSMMLFGICL